MNVHAVAVAGTEVERLGLLPWHIFIIAIIDIICLGILPFAGTKLLGKARNLELVEAVGVEATHSSYRHLSGIELYIIVTYHAVAHCRVAILVELNLTGGRIEAERTS